MRNAVTAQEGTPVWIWAVAMVGVAWNIFGLVQLADFVTQTHASLVMKGMSAKAADLYYALPVWRNWPSPWAAVVA